MSERAAGWLRAAALCGPFVLAFFSGGYFDPARSWAGAVAWALLLAGLLLARRMPRPGAGAVVALSGLAGLAAWTLVSIAWAPVTDSAYHRGQTAVLYLGALAAAYVLLSAPRAGEAVEPALALGTLVIVGYGVSERLLPGMLQFARSTSAEGRLEQPLTYWNAMGELAAIGVVLVARIAGDTRRAAWLRTIAAAAAPPLALGLYLSFSRGALFACAAGLLTLVVAAGDRAQLRAVIVVVASSALAVLVAAPFRELTALAGRLGSRERAGALELVVLGAAMAVAALGTLRLTREDPAQRLRLPRRAGALAALVLCAGLALAIAVGGKEGSGRTLSAGAGRLVTLQSNRYAYWNVALHDFAQQPLRGVGAGGWAVSWLRRRHINEYAVDAHSLPLQTLAELGIVGLLLLATFLGGVAAAATRVWRASPAVAAGPIAVCITWLAHQPLDWDWEMPALTLVALIAAGALLAAEAQSASAIRGASRRNTSTAATQIPT